MIPKKSMVKLENSCGCKSVYDNKVILFFDALNFGWIVDRDIIREICYPNLLRKDLTAEEIRNYFS